MDIAGTWHIINISVLAGREVYPKGNVYMRDQHLSRQFRKLDFERHRIVTTSPGMVETEFSLSLHGTKCSANFSRA
jgi:NADP-dependent 3-hydroxy acid dehydrogenase YdfG